MPTYVPPKKNTAYVFYWSLVSQANTKIFQASPTLAAGDVKVAVDDGVAANITTLPTVDANLTKRIKVSLSAAEMNGDNITLVFSDAAGAEWCDVTIDIPTAARQVDDLATPTNITAASGVALSNAGVDALFTRQLTESYAADGAAPTVAQALMLIQQAMTEGAISSTTWTVKKLDGSTAAATITLDSAGTPTSKTRST